MLHDLINTTLNLNCEVFFTLVGKGDQTEDWNPPAFH